VHRDIKPSNIRLAADDFVKLMDFGIAKSFRSEVAQTDTGTGRAIGTPQFMAPEQILDHPVDHRADLYAVGATLFAMLTGEPPFASTSFTQRMHVLTEAAPSIEALRGGLPPALVAAIARALERSPDDRFPHAVAFAAALEDAAVAAEARANAATRPAPLPGKRGPTPAAVTRAAQPPDGTPRRSSRPLVAGALALVAITALVVILVMRERTRPMTSAAPPAPVAIASIQPDAAVVIADAAPIDAAHIDAAPLDAPTDKKRTRVATPAPPAPKGPRCFCKVKFGERQSISTACKRKAPAPRCECEKTSTRLCPFVMTVTNGDRERLPDGTGSGTMRCLDRTRPECDWVNGPVPKDCWAMSKVATANEACRGYRSGQKAEDAMLDGKYRCNFCDLTPEAPKYYGTAGDACTGFEVTTGEPASGELECPAP
jgi:Protein kinase domain